MRRLIATALLGLAGCGAGGPGAPGDGARRIIAANCAACHTVPGVDTARGRVGPNLAGVGSRQVIAGRLPNSRPNMIRWIAHAQDIAPGSAMPDIPLTQAEAAAVADYLYSLD